MPDTMDRRSLLTSAVLGSAATIVGATALGSLAPEAAFAGGADRRLYLCFGHGADQP